LETHKFGTDDEAYRVFHHTGKCALYRIKAQPTKLTDFPYADGPLLARCFAVL
jgi:hypothetical protein